MTFLFICCSKDRSILTQLLYFTWNGVKKTKNVLTISVETQITLFTNSSDETFQLPVKDFK